MSSLVRQESRREGISFLLAPLVFAAGCGGLSLAAESSVDAGDTGNAEEAAHSSEVGCRFALKGDGLDTTVSETVALAYPAGAEIPFAFFECQIESGSALYTLTGQYMPGETSSQMWLSVGADAEERDEGSAFCPVKGSLGPALDASPDPYTYGAPLSLRFSCDFPSVELPDGRRGPIKLTNGEIQTQLMRPEP
jgi:hypothetical protein